MVQVSKVFDSKEREIDTKQTQENLLGAST